MTYNITQGNLHICAMKYVITRNSYHKDRKILLLICVLGKYIRHIRHISCQTLSLILQ